MFCSRIPVIARHRNLVNHFYQFQIPWGQFKCIVLCKNCNNQTPGYISLNSINFRPWAPMATFLNLEVANILCYVKVKETIQNYQINFLKLSKYVY